MQIILNIIGRYLYFVDLTTFHILGQIFVKFFFGFLENLRNQKDILRLTDLYYANKVGGNVVNSLRRGALQACIDCCLDTFTRLVKKIENYY